MEDQLYYYSYLEEKLNEILFDKWYKLIYYEYYNK